MSIGPYAAMQDIKHRQFAGRDRKELLDFLDIFRRALFGWHLALNAMDVPRGNACRMQQRFKRQLVVALVASRGDTSLVDPEKVNSRPVELAFRHSREEQLRRFAS